MLRFLALSLLVSLGVIVLTAQPGKQNIVGTWQLLSRVDRDSAGNLLEEPSLGKDPLGYLVYDAAGNVFAQLMARQRSPNSLAVTAPSDKNNPVAVGGYDAYFGNYKIDTMSGTITHKLEGAISQMDIGRSLTRRFHLQGDTLTIQFEPGGKGSTRTRTLIWHRVSR